MSHYQIVIWIGFNICQTQPAYLQNVRRQYCLDHWLESMTAKNIRNTISRKPEYNDDDDDDNDDNDDDDADSDLEEEHAGDQAKGSRATKSTRVHLQ